MAAGDPHHVPRLTVWGITVWGITVVGITVVGITVLSGESTGVAAWLRELRAPQRRATILRDSS